MESDEILEIRKEKVIEFLKEKKEWAFYLALGFIVFLSVYIRTLNIPKLKDITTGTWTLGPDLDPFLFLRWAKYIVEHGKLFVIDSMRNVPLSEICSGATCNPISTASEMKLLPYMIAWFYHVLAFFSKDVTVTYAAIIFPAFMFGLTAIAFFLFARKIFYKETKITRNLIALVATSFFIVVPSLLPRTIAGIPEKESAAFFFMFLAFYLFIEAFTSNKMKRALTFGIFAGISTGLMGLIWGGVIFIFFTIPPTVLVSFIIGKIKRKELLIYSCWMFTSFIVMMPFSTRYSIKNLIMSTSTGLAIGVFFIIGASIFIMKSKWLNKLRKKTKLPKEVFAMIVSVIILLMIISITIRPSFILRQMTNVKNSLITPTTTRFGLTVAENKQPYFINDWKNSFGPVFKNIPLYFWLFFAGSVALFAHLIRKLKQKEKFFLLVSYFIFLISIIFSRYSPSSSLNGVSGLSLTVYFGGWMIFLGCFGYSYYKKYHEKEASVFKEMNFAYILYFLVLTLGIIGARGGIRLIMVLGAVSPVAVAFLIVKSSEKFFKEKDDTKKTLIGIIIFIVILASLFTFWTYYKSDVNTARNFAPGPYQWQWQKAMEWVRENTTENAVFAHWWDYGYWIQSIGERATILDGGNAIVYWNHLLGRYVLTGTDEKKSLEFLYTHNATHLLIDSTDIGKYTAYASIGSDENYDRLSWISTFLMDERQTQETKNQTIYVYQGGTLLDEDIIWEDNGKEIFLPKKAAGIGAIILKVENNGNIKGADGIFVYNRNQYRIPLRYVYSKGKLYDFKKGLDAGVFLFPSLKNSNQGTSISKIGAAMYLSKKTFHSELARLYLFNEPSDYFKLAHTQDSFVIESMKSQGLSDIGEFVYYQGFQGPIKIWKISYPKDIKINPEYLRITYPNKNLEIAKPGEY